MIIKIIQNKKCKIKVKNNHTIFKLNNYFIAMPTLLADKISKLIKKRRYSLIQELIDIYKDDIKTNFTFWGFSYE